MHMELDCDDDWNYSGEFYKAKREFLERIKNNEESQEYGKKNQRDSYNLYEMNYEDYLKSKCSKKRRLRALKIGGYKCSKCKSIKKLQVHHLSYNRRGRELDSDLTVFCNKCHSDIHSKTKRKSVV